MPRGRPKKSLSSNNAEILDKITEELLNKQGESVSVEPKTQNTDNGQQNEIIPDINSAEWTPFLMGKLLEDEIIDGCPKVEGLRRLVYEYIGEIVESISRVVQAPNFIENGCHSCVEHHITVLTDNGIRKFSGVADVFTGNGSNGMFSWQYSSATCETRAESRALRKTLRLRNIVAADELSDVAPEGAASGIIQDNQINFLDMICKRLDINVMKYINIGELKYETINKVPYSTAIKMFGHLQLWQQDMTKIPAELKGYNSKWNQKPQ